MIQYQPLSAVCELITDGTHFTPKDVGLGVPFLTVKDMSDKGLDFENCSKISLSDYENADRQNSAPKPGDVLFSKDGTVGKVHVVKERRDFAILSSIAILRPKQETLDAGFLGHFLRTPASVMQASQRKTGSALTRIVLKDIRDLKVPILPIDEQRRIAAILDQADVLRRARRRALDRLNDLGQAIFYDMFGDLVLNDRGWPQRKVSDFVAGFQSGKNLVADDQNEANSRFRVLKVSAVTSLEFRADESKPLPVEYRPPEQHFVKAGDLLFSRANTEELIGATALVLGGGEGLVLPDKIWKFIWYPDDRADPFFVWHLFRQQRFRNEIRKRATGTSGSMKNIPQEKVLGLAVGLPDKRLQSKFASIIRSSEELKQSVKRHFHDLEDLFSSLQRRAFAGELR